MNCNNCTKEILQGNNVVGVNEGVVGLHGFVALREAEYYCTRQCAIGGLAEEVE